MTHAERLADWMAREGLSVVKAAARIGCDPSAVYLWIQGKRTPTGLYAEKVERVLSASERKGETR